MTHALSAGHAERRFILLTATRWLPVGVVFGLTVLLPLERGLSLAQVGALLAVQGFVVLGLELPTGGLADALGRRPLLVASGVLAVASALLMVVATGFWMFAAAMLLQGVFRALDSGPLEAWYVDGAQAADAGAPIERGLGRASGMLGLAIAAGALAGGGLVAWRPIAGWSALALPFVVATVLYALHATLVALLVREPSRRPRTPTSPTPAPTSPRSHFHVQIQRFGRRSDFSADGVGVDAPTSTRATRHGPRAFAPVAEGVRLLGRSRVLRCLVLVEVFWSVAMIAFETLTPVGLAGFLGGEDAAAAPFGPASAAAWGLFALGSLLGATLGRRIGVARAAIVARILNGGFVVLMGLALGPVGLLAGYGLAYLTHGAAGPLHSTLLHREASAANRSVVLSINSMIAGGSYSLGLLILTPLAQTAGTGVAFVAAGAFSVIGALLYLPAAARERETRAECADRALRLRAETLG